MSEPLFLTSIKLKMAGLVAMGNHQRLAMRYVDECYLVHVWLCAAFGEGPTLKPWVVEAYDGHELHIMGYSKMDIAALREAAKANTTPELFETADWDACESRQMPNELSPGKRIRIKVRVCPTKRTIRGEKDAFLLAIDGKPKEFLVDREAVYADWLRDAVGRVCPGDLSDIRMSSFQLVNVFRRVQGDIRKSALPRLPEATMEATFTVGEAGIGELFTRGLGRHRSFGLGMVRVIPLRDTDA